MSFEFTRYGSKTDYIEVKSSAYIKDPDSITKPEEITAYDKTASRLIEDCEKLIAKTREYRAELAARYGTLIVMNYSDVLKITRRHSYDGHIVYEISIEPTFEDGTHRIEYFESKPGKERREALKRFEELKKENPSATLITDIERRPWER